MNTRNTIVDVLRKIASDKRMLNRADYWALICGEAADLLEADANALLKAQQPQVDCGAANKDAGGCLGYGYSENDDEPIPACRKCRKYTSYAE